MAQVGPNRWLQLAALSTVPFTMVLGNSMLMPVLPEMGHAMGLTKSVTGLAVTAFSLAAGLAIAIAGFLADRYGRKLVIVPSLVLFGLGGLIAGSASWWLADDGLWLIMVGRVVQGLGASGMAPVAMAFGGDLFAGKDRVTALGILEGSNGLGKVVSPIAGALIGQALVWWGVFYAHAAVALPFAPLVWLVTVEPARKPAADLKTYLGSVLKIFRQKGVPLGACLWIGLINQFTLFGVFYFLSQNLESEYELHGLAKGWMLLWPVLGMSLTAFGSGLLLRRHQDWLKPAVFIGVSIVLVGVIVVALFEHDWAFMGGMILVGVGTGLQLPALNNLITSAAATEQRGAITAIYGAVRFIGVAFGPPVFGMLMGFGDTLPFWSNAGLLVVTAAVTLLWVRPDQIIQSGGGGDGGGSSKIPAWQPPVDLPSGTRGGPSGR